MNRRNFLETISLAGAGVFLADELSAQQTGIDIITGNPIILQKPKGKDGVTLDELLARVKGGQRPDVGYRAGFDLPKAQDDVRNAGFSFINLPEYFIGITKDLEKTGLYVATEGLPGNGVGLRCSGFYNEKDKSLTINAWLLYRQNQEIADFQEKINLMSEHKEHDCNARTNLMAGKIIALLTDARRYATVSEAKKLTTVPKENQVVALRFDEAGREYRKQKLLEEANQMFETSICYNPKNIGAWQCKAACTYQLSGKDAAIKVIEEGLIINPNNKGLIAYRLLDIFK